MYIFQKERNRFKWLWSNTSEVLTSKNHLLRCRHSSLTKKLQFHQPCVSAHCRCSIKVYEIKIYENSYHILILSISAYTISAHLHWVLFCLKPYIFHRLLNILLYISHARNVGVILGSTPPTWCIAMENYVRIAVFSNSSRMLRNFKRFKVP